MDLDKLRRGLLQKIHNTAQTFKANTLDKTDLDERLVSKARNISQNKTVRGLGKAAFNTAAPSLNLVRQIGQTPQYQSAFNASANQLKNQVTQGIPAMYRLTDFANPQKPFTFGGINGVGSSQRILQNPQQFASDITKAGSFAATAYGAPKLTPQLMGVSGLLGGAFNRFGGGSFSEGFGKGVAVSPQIAGITRLTNPVINNTASRFSSQFSNPLVRSLTGRGATGALNVPEGMAIDASLGQPTTLGSMGIDFASGFATGRTGTGGKVRLRPSKGLGMAKNQYEYMKPEHKDDVGKLIENLIFKGEDLNYNIQNKSKIEDQLRMYAEMYINKDFAWGTRKAGKGRNAQQIYKTSLQDVAQELMNRIRSENEAPDLFLPQLPFAAKNQTKIANAGGLSDMPKLYQEGSKFYVDTSKVSKQEYINKLLTGIGEQRKGNRSLLGSFYDDQLKRQSNVANAGLYDVGERFEKLPSGGMIDYEIKPNEIVINGVRGNSSELGKGSGEATKRVRELMAQALQENKSIRVSGISNKPYWNYLGFDTSVKKGQTYKDYATLTPEQLRNVIDRSGIISTIGDRSSRTLGRSQDVGSSPTLRTNPRVAQPSLNDTELPEGALGFANISSEGTKMRSGKIRVRNFPTQTEVKNRAELNAGNPDLYTQRGQKLDEMFGSSDEAFTGLKDNVAQQGAAEARVAMTGGGVNNFDRELKNSFQNWVNTRSASRVEGFLKKKEYKDLDSLGMDAIFDFQSSSNKTPRFKELNSYLDSKRQEVIKKTGTDFGYKQNYLPQLWDNTEEEIQQALGNRLSQKSTFMLSSVIKDYKEGIAKGLTPRYKTISELAGWYEQHANKLIADADFFQYLGKEGFISSSGKAPQHWVTLDPDRFPKINVSVDGTKYTGAYKAPPDLAEAINNYLRDPQFKMLNTVADYVSRVKNVALNFGIPGTGINMHGVNMLARHTLMGTGGNPVSRMIKAGTFMVNPKAAERELDTLMKRAPKAVKDGLTVSAEGYSGIGDQAENIAGQFSKKWEDLFGTPLFNKMIPALKISSYEKLVKDGMNGKDAAKLVNNVYGGINWEQMGRNRDFQNLLRSIILAPDWGETTVRLGGNFVKALNPMHKSATANRYRTMMATIIASYVAHNVVNKISSGHYSYENDPGHTFEIEAGYTADGQKRYLRPYGTALDMVRLPYDIAKGLTQGDISGLARTVRNRLSIPLGVVVGGLTDTDYRGNTIGYRGTDRFGNEMPASQRAVNIGSEVASFVGFPSFAKQFGLSATGQQGLEQGLLQGFELPFRYSNTGNSNVQEQLNFIAQDQGLEGKELYDFNQSLRGHRVLTDKQLEKVKAGGEDALDDILSNRTPTTNEEAERVFEESPEAPQNVMERVHMAAQGMTKDPGNVIKAIFTEERMRKIENDAVILERELYLNNLNDKNLHVDHVIPLGLGGDNSDGNLQVMTVDEKTKKDKLEKQLIYQLQTGQIDRVSAQAQIRAFNMENPVGVPYDRMSKTKQKALEDKVVEITDVEDENGYPTMPKLTGNKELDKKLMSKFKGEITKKKNEIVKAYEAGEMTAEEAEAELMKLNSIESSSKAKSGKGRAKKLKIKFVKPKYVEGKVRASSNSVLDNESAGIPNFTIPQISTPDMQVPNIRVGTPSKPVFNVKFNL